MLTTWMRTGGGDAHIVTKAGNRYITTCMVTLERVHARAVTTRWTEHAPGHFHVRPVEGRVCQSCEDAAIEREM